MSKSGGVRWTNIRVKEMEPCQNEGTKNEMTTCVLRVQLNDTNEERMAVTDSQNSTKTCFVGSITTSSKFLPTSVLTTWLSQSAGTSSVLR